MANRRDTSSYAVWFGNSRAACLRGSPIFARLLHYRPFIFREKILGAGLPILSLPN